MTEKNSSATNTLILAAIIGALGGILAACIGLVPAILPIVRPSFTPRAPETATPPPTYTETNVPDTETATITPTDLPTMTATLEPLPTDTPVTQTATITVTAIAPSSDMAAYIGTWVNEENFPKSDKVRLILSRVKITQTGEATADFSVCRSTKAGPTYVQPNPAPASIYVLGLGARDFVIQNFPDLRWAIVVQRTADQLVATVQEYSPDNILLDTDTFNMKKANIIENLTDCKQPTNTTP
jgi:hypothetical protein